MKSHVSLIPAGLVTLSRAATSTVDNTSNSGAGSLRQAVLDAAVSPGADTVVFSPIPFQPLNRIGMLGTSSGIDDNTLESHGIPAGTNRALVVVACHAADTDITGVSFGGLPLTQVIERTDGYVVASIWTRAMGSSAIPVTGNIVVTRAGTDSLTQTIFAANYANVDQTLPMDSPVTDPNTVATTTTLTVSSRPGDLVFNLIDGFKGGTLSNLGGSMVLNRCTVSGNSAISNGGGIDNDQGSCTLSHSTISGNQAANQGGGVCSAGAPTAMVINHCTLSENTSSNTLSDGVSVSSQTTVLTNSIVFGNGNGDLVNESGQLQRQGANIVGIFANAGSPAAGTDSGPPAINADPHLAGLGNFGGPTRTMALLSGSPARDASLASSATGDQRGFPIVGTADLGAYESANLIQNYQAWALETLPGTLTTSQRAATSDLDGDGATNTQEWVAGTNIEDGNSIFRITTFSGGNGAIHAVCPTVIGRNYHLETATDLALWMPVPGTARTGNGLDLTYDLTGLGASSPAFFRIGVTP